MGISSRKMRGIGFEVEEMMKLFLVIIIGLGIVILIIAASGGISSLLTEFCAKNPGICGGQDPNSQKNYQTAKDSVNALVCAINSVAKGQNLCPNSASTGLSLSRNFGSTGFAVSNDNSAASVKCETKKVEINQYDAEAVWVHTELGEKINPEIHFNCASHDIGGLGYGEDCYTCKDGKRIPNTDPPKCEIVLKSAFTCAVSNFQLPQKVTEKWIWTYGDPQYVAYWQVFPVEADTWSFKVDWKIHVAIALVTILPPTKVANGFAKVAAEKITASITAREAETTLTNQLVSIAKQRIEKEKLRAITKFGVLEGAALATEYAASTRAKFYPDKNAFVMKSPFENKEPFNLVSELEGKPVFLKWSTNDILDAGGGAIDTAHFVSPCNIQSMDVEKAKVICDEYFVSSKTGIVQCAKFANVEKATDDQSGLWYSAKSYISRIFSSGQEPSCDINYYIDVSEPYINDMDYIKGMNTQDLTKSVFNGNAPQPKSCDEGNSEATITLNGKSYTVGGCYKNNPVRFDKIEIRDGNKVETLLDTDFDGYFDSYTLKGCKTDAIIISNVKKATVSNDYNYCFDETARFLSWGQASTYGAAIGTAVVFAIAFPPSTIVSGLAVIGSIFAVQQGTYEAITEFDKARDRWPGRG